MNDTARPMPARLVGRARSYLRRCVEIDTRTLAVFRVFAGLLVIADLVLRSRNFTFFYTDEGVVPRSLVLEFSAGSPLSIYHLTTSTTVIATLFVLQGLIAVQLIVGYRTRLATILTFAFVVSLDHHNPFVLSFADTLFRLLLFWAIFLPLGERWSIDAVHADREPRAAIASIASALILGQMVFMYFTNGLIKSQSDIWGSGDSAPLVMGIHEMTFLLGDFMAQFPTLLSYGGLAWYYMLLISPLLILLPGRKRLPLVAAFVIGHAAFAVTVRIGAFAYVALAGVLLFVQTPVWEDATRAIAAVGVDSDRLDARTAPLAALANRVPDIRLGGDRVRRLRAHTYTVAVGVIVVTLVFVGGTILASLAPVLVAEDDRSLEEGVEAEIHEAMAEPGVAQVETVASSLGIDQPIGWSVFAGPDPRTSDRYYVFPAETTSGEYVDAFNDRLLSYDRPTDELQTQHSTYRERFYMNSVRRGGFSNDVPVELAEHYCETWTTDDGDELEAISMYLVTEEITLETIDRPDDRDRWYTEMYRHGCGDNDPVPFDPPE